MKIKDILKSGDVSRFHSNTGISKQPISDHSWGVSLLCQYFNPNCSKELILAALTHDCAEAVTGDTPAPAKWLEPKLKVLLDSIEERVEADWGINFTLSLDEKRLLKLCDGLEGMSYCIKRRSMGELEATAPFYKWAQFIDYNNELSELEEEYYMSLLTQMEEINGS